jgi:hypothetical protein
MKQEFPRAFLGKLWLNTERRKKEGGGSYGLLAAGGVGGGGMSTLKRSKHKKPWRLNNLYKVRDI